MPIVRLLPIQVLLRIKRTSIYCNVIAFPLGVPVRFGSPSGHSRVPRRQTVLRRCQGNAKPSQARCGNTARLRPLPVPNADPLTDSVSHFRWKSQCSLKPPPGVWGESKKDALRRFNRVPIRCISAGGTIAVNLCPQKHLD